MTAIKIAPSILAADFGELKKQIELINNADMIHIDVMDGQFVPAISNGQMIVSTIKSLTNTPLDVHLMTLTPEKHIKSFAKAGADIITFHIEATENPELCIKIAREHNVKIGIAIKPNTSHTAILKFMDSTDMVLVMTVEPGLGGQKYMNEMNEKIKEVRSMIGGKDLQVDGGISMDTISMPYECGANVFVCGTALFSADNPAEYIERLKPENK